MSSICIERQLLGGINLFNKSLPIYSKSPTEKMEGNRNNGNHQFSQPNPPNIGTSRASGVSLNVHLAVPPTTTAAQDGSHTPNTPEILNSIVKLQAEREEAREAYSSSGPFGAEFARQCAIRSTPIETVSPPNDKSSGEPEPVKAISTGYNQIEPPTINVIPPVSSPAGSSITSESTLISPLSSPATTPGSVPGALVSQFIKEDLNLKLKMKAKQNMGDAGSRPTKTRRRSSSTRTPGNIGEIGADNKDSLSQIPSFNSGSRKLSPIPMLSPTDSEEAYPIDINAIKKEGLTSEDTQRRLRRRERNKIAATKCRNKKKARTQILIRESETLSVQNQSLKNEIHKLEQEKVRLMQVLSGHDNTCLQRMQQESMEIKRENFPSSMDDNEFRVPVTIPVDPTIPNPHGLSTTVSNFTLPSSSYVDRTNQVPQPLLNSPLTNNPNLIQFNISQSSQLDLHHQPLMTSGHDMIATVSPSDCQPPSFDDAVAAAPEIKMEDNSQDTAVPSHNVHHQPIQQGFTPIFDSDPPLQQMNENHHDALRAATFGNHGLGDASNYFLAKRPLGHTYLDLDSRCIAL